MSLRESTRVYARAGWWRRMIAWILDAFVIALPVYAIVALSGLGAHSVRGLSHVAASASRPVISLETQVVELALWVAAQTIYHGILEGAPRGQTLGKRWMGIATVDATTGGPIGIARAATRAALFSSALACLLLPGIVDGVWPLFDPDRSSLHDRVMSTAVIDVFPS